MDSVRPRLVAVLNHIAAAKDDQITFADNATLEEVGLVAQLIDNGYLDRSYVPNERGIPCHAVVTGITLSGRRFVDELDEAVQSQRYFYLQSWATKEKVCEKGIRELETKNPEDLMDELTVKFIKNQNEE